MKIKSFSFIIIHCFFRSTENVGSTVIQQWDRLERDAVASEISAAFEGYYGKGDYTPSCTQHEAGLQSETSKMTNLKQLNYLLVKPSTNNDWNVTIKCQHEVSAWIKSVYYYLGQYPSHLFFSKIHGLNKPHLFLRNSYSGWDIIAMRSYYPCSQYKNQINAIVEADWDGKTLLRSQKGFSFFPTWPVLFMTNHNVIYRGRWPKAFYFTGLMNMSDTKTISVGMEGNSTYVGVEDGAIQLSSNHGPIKANGYWSIEDSFYYAEITIESNYWWKCVDKYFPEEIAYTEPEVTAPAKKVKKLLLDNVRTMQVNTCFFKKFLCFKRFYCFTVFVLS